MSPSAEALPRLHVVTDDSVLARPGFREDARAVLEAGGPEVALHVRGPHAAGAAVYALTRALLGVAEQAGAWLVVNDRVDVALALGLTRVHLGARSLPCGEARTLLGGRGVIGCSAHDPQELEGTTAAGADFVFFGNVFATASHPGRPGTGLDGLAAAVKGAGSVPVLAIGGVDTERIDDVWIAGAHGAAVLSGVWSASDPAARVRGYISALRGAAERRQR